MTDIVPNENETPLERQKSRKEVFAEMSGVVVNPVYQFFIGVFFYLGLMGFFPWVIIHMLYVDPIEFEFDFSDTNFIFIFIVVLFVILAIMDNYGIRSTHLDRVSKKLTSIVSLFGGIVSTMIFTHLSIYGWMNADVMLVLMVCILGVIFGILGWFHIRFQKAFKSPEHNELQFEAAGTSLIITSFIYLFGFIEVEFSFFPLIAMFLIYPFALLKYSDFEVNITLKLRDITQMVRQMTAGQFLIDVFKALAIIFTIVSVLFDATLIFHENWIYNFFFMTLSAGAFILIFERIQDRVEGLLNIIIVFILAIGLHLISNYLPPFSGIYSLMAIINGGIIAGVFFFIEQKAQKSVNVRAFAGLYYYLVLFIFILVFFIRSTEPWNQIFDFLKVLFSIIGLANITGYLRRKYEN